MVLLKLGYIGIGIMLLSLNLLADISLPCGYRERERYSKRWVLGESNAFEYFCGAPYVLCKIESPKFTINSIEPGRIL